MTDIPKELQEKRDEQDGKIEIIFRKSTPMSDPECRYPGFKPGTTVLPKGSVHREGALPLPCDVVFERDVAVPMRDGTVIYINIFRPVGDDKVPAIVGWSPYGKEGGFQTLDQMPFRFGIPVSALSDLQAWEGPDPAYWCRRGYAILNTDGRGAGNSEGNMSGWGEEDGRDGYDVIEWVAAQPWSNGKVGMYGNSSLAMSQWWIAAEQPPHLTCIAPWEGTSIQSPSFTRSLDWVCSPATKERMVSRKMRSTMAMTAPSPLSSTRGDLPVNQEMDSTTPTKVKRILARSI